MISLSPEEQERKLSKGGEPQEGWLTAKWRSEWQKNILKKEEASKLFKKAIEDERRIWEDEEADRAEEAQEEAVRRAREADPSIDPADVPIVGVIPRFFFR